MDFFEAQDNAIRKTKRLVLYYILAVLAIIVAVYVAVTIGILAYHHWTAPRTPAEDAGYGQYVSLWDTGRFLLVAFGVVVLVGLGSLYKTIALRGGGAAVAKSLGGERVDRSTRSPKRKQLLNVVEEMAIASGVPVPEVYILQGESSINAFAAGWSFDDAVIAVSAGALEQLSRDELQGVVAHEYSHILYGDCRLNIRLMGVLFGIMMLTVFGRLLGAIFRGGGRRRGGPVVFVGGGRRRRGGGSSGGGGKGGALVLAIILVVILVTIIGYIGTFFARLIQAAISRQREYLADAAAVQFTRSPDGIAGALKKIGAAKHRAVLEHPSASEAAHMFFADGLRRSFYTSAFATHPPLKARIRKIQPDWKEEAEQPEEEKAEPEAPAQKVQVKQYADGRKFIEGMSVIGAVGSMGSENIATARRITSSIPDHLDERMRSEEGARQAIVSLVMADNPLDDEAQWQVVEVAVPPDDLAELRTVYETVRELPRETRLAILELASTTLAQAHIAAEDDYLTLLNNLIQTDAQLTLYEFCVRRILRERLERGNRTTAGASSVQYMQLKPKVAKAVGNLLSIISREVAGARDPSELMARSLKAQYLLNDKVAYEEASEGEIIKLDRSLDVLRSSAFAIRAQCLRAVVFLTKADGKLTAEEAEVLRMLSLSLECPVPPIGI